MGLVTKWTPITNPMHLRRLGKTAEEASELTFICNRSILQGLDSENPKTGVKNRRALEQEIADVLCQLRFTSARLNLDSAYIEKRAEEKQRDMEEWEAMFEDEEPKA